MANRSYLYTSSFEPDTGRPRTPDDRISGIAEWNYAVPLVFRILVSVDPRSCPSLIWTDIPEPIAVAARCGPGVERLRDFLTRIDHPYLGTLAADAMQFLDERTAPDDWFVLECAEVFAMHDAPIAKQNARAVEQLAVIDVEIEATLADLTPAAPNIWQRIFTPTRASCEAPLRALGLGNWSETLYFDLTSGR
ncbi:hypothetical protein A6410_22685 [Prescottella equi]|nr:hypothetical protein A6410_22685 [Prescottella equi]